jgi:hypothetical protein
MDDLLKVLVTGVLGVGVGGLLSWKAGLNQRVEDSVRSAYAEFGAAWEVYLHAVEVHVHTWWQRQFHRGGVYNADEEAEEIEETRQARQDRFSALLASWQRVLMLDKDPVRRKFLKRLVSDSHDATGLPSATPEAMGHFIAGIEGLRTQYDEFRDALPTHFTSLGLWAAGD